jgi:hypothetical protein
MHTFRYSAAARRRAAVLLVVSIVLVIGLLGALITQRVVFGWPSLLAGGVLVLFVLATARAQLSRLTFRCTIDNAQLRLAAFGSAQTFAWERIAEVRRMRIARLGQAHSWACTILTPGRSGNPLPTYAFDHELDDAEQALQLIVDRTPHAQHKVD